MDNVEGSRMDKMDGRKKVSDATRAELEALISGESIEQRILSELTYGDLQEEDWVNRQTYLWSILYATGYLTDVTAPKGDLHRLAIPNKEVLGIYENRISSWFRGKALGNSQDWRSYRGEGISFFASQGGDEDHLSIRDNLL